MPADLEALRRLAAAATPGPWYCGSPVSAMPGPTPVNPKQADGVCGACGKYGPVVKQRTQGSRDQRLIHVHLDDRTGEIGAGDVESGPLIATVDRDPDYPKGNGRLEDARFIAACDPTTVLELLDEVERLRAEVQEERYTKGVIVARGDAAIRRATERERAAVVTHLRSDAAEHRENGDDVWMNFEAAASFIEQGGHRG